MTTEQHLYLLLQTKQPLSKKTLLEDLAITVDEFLHCLANLEKEGIRIQWTPDGYQIQSGDLLLPDWLSQEIGIPVHYNPNSLSTQEDAKESLSQTHNTPTLYLAPTQKEARGRFGRQFFTSQTGIYMSLHLRQKTAVTDETAYTLMVAAAVYKAIAQLTGIQTSIKWVNDIYLNHRKIAGILTERFSDKQDPSYSHLIIGVGINFAIADFPESLQHKAGSLFLKQPSITRNQLISRIWQLFLNIPEHELIKVYKDRSLVLDQWVTFEENGTTYKGLVTDITDQGELCLQLSDSKTKRLSAGDISLTSWTS